MIEMEDKKSPDHLPRRREELRGAEEQQARYAQRGTSIEPFFGTIKDFFCLNPLPRQGKRHAATFILLALYAWNLLVLFNFLNDRPLGAVKSLLDCL